jgi:cbb3-type cytochrome oxidase cytochrome c subunit
LDIAGNRPHPFCDGSGPDLSQVNPERSRSWTRAGLYESVDVEEKRAATAFRALSAPSVLFPRLPWSIRRPGQIA